MDTEEEKKSSLFADLIEYREAISALEEFRAGFNVSIDRKWPTLGDPAYTVTITKRVSELKKFGRPQVAVKSDGNLLTAVRGAVAQLRAAIAAEQATQEAGQKDMAAMGFTAEVELRILKNKFKPGKLMLSDIARAAGLDPDRTSARDMEAGLRVAYGMGLGQGIISGSMEGPLTPGRLVGEEYLRSQNVPEEDSRPSTGL